MNWGKNVCSRFKKYFLTCMAKHPLRTLKYNVSLVKYSCYICLSLPIHNILKGDWDGDMLYNNTLEDIYYVIIYEVIGCLKIHKNL